MRLLPIVAALLLGFVGSAMAQSFDTPEAMLTALHAPYLSDEIPENSEIFRSQALNALYEAIDFDPVINGQDWIIADFAIGKIQVDGDTAIARVTFKNFDTANTLDFTLVNEDGWKYDNIVASGGDNEYSLVDVFKDYE